MTIDDIARLRGLEQKIAIINCTNGELLKAKILHVDDEHRDAIFDLISTDHPQTYKGTGTYVIHWDDIEDFREDQN